MCLLLDNALDGLLVLILVLLFFQKLHHILLDLLVERLHHCLVV